MSQRPDDNLDPADYDVDEDGLPREIVGIWAREKHERVKKYVGISAAVRKRFIGPDKAGATYIDLFCGPGRVLVKDTSEAVAGSPLVAYNESVLRKSPFSSVHVSDANATLTQAAASRLKIFGAPISLDTGLGEEVVERMIARLDRYALHFAFLDPYSLSALPFTIIKQLATLERMDILIHVSTQDLNRNLRRYLVRTSSPLDRFAPGWRETVVDLERSDAEVRGKIFEHWRMLLK